MFDKTPATGIPDFDVGKLAIVPFSAGGGGGGASPTSATSPGLPGGGGGAAGNGGGAKQHGATARSSLHFASRLHSGDNTGAESSNDDSTFMRIPLKKKKKRMHNSLSPTGNGSPTDIDMKRRKKV